jgi:hypothetical protein
VDAEGKAGQMRETRPFRFAMLSREDALGKELYMLKAFRPDARGMACQMCEENQDRCERQGRADARSKARQMREARPDT